MAKPRNYEKEVPMALMSLIEWCMATWNCILGCSIVSPGCHNCYAMAMARRLKGIALAKIARGKDPGRHRHYIQVIGDNGRWNGNVFLVPEALNDPLRWRRPQIIFVNSMSDLFHENLSVEDIGKVCDVMARANHHIFQVLTKRASRMQELLAGQLREFAGLEHIWWGVSVENRPHGLPRIEHLRNTPARVRFLSVEPLLEDLGPIDLTGIHWVIAGGESGVCCRPMEADWVTSVRDQCQSQGVPFFFKQWGGRNKKAAGRMLDGRTWDEMPGSVSLPVVSATTPEGGEPNWPAFYEALRKLGLEILEDVDEHVMRLIPLHNDGNEFWSESLELLLREWWRRDPEKAVREVIAQWARNVQARMTEVYGGVGKSFFVISDEDADDVPEPQTMIASIRPRHDPVAIARLMEAARTKKSESGQT
jgi:protein gp37